MHLHYTLMQTFYTGVALGTASRSNPKNLRVKGFAPTSKTHASSLTKN
jgi:hypothetical protein